MLDDDDDDDDDTGLSAHVVSSRSTVLHMCASLPHLSMFTLALLVLAI
jgi:hypothetical protein